MNENNRSDSGTIPDLANIVGSKVISEKSAKTLTVNDPLKGQRVIVPVSDEIAQFIKSEFAKVSPL